MDRTELLAYETGYHLGDGHLQIHDKSRTNRITYCGDSRKDAEFCEKILPKIIWQLYKVKPRIYKRSYENTILVVVNSKRIAKEKIKLGLPAGNKIKLQCVPKWIDSKLATHFMRGLADADFSLTFKKNRKGVACEPRIEYFTNNKVLAEFVHRNLKKLGFKPAFEDTFSHGRYKEYRVRMYGKAMLENWMALIGFQNPKHLRKVKLFKKFGFYPRSFL